jgi:hypothetical protein
MCMTCDDPWNLPLYGRCLKLLEAVTVGFEVSFELYIDASGPLWSRPHNAGSPESWQEREREFRAIMDEVRGKMLSR